MSNNRVPMDDAHRRELRRRQLAARRLRERRRRQRMILLCVFIVLVAFGGALALNGIGKNKLESEAKVPGSSANLEIPEINETSEIETMQTETESETIPEEPQRPWNLILVNRWNPLPEDYELELMEVEGGEQVDARIYEPLMHMLNDAQALGYGPIVVSGYRTQEKQQELYDQKLAEFMSQGYDEAQATELTLEWVALPGASEHQLGLAADINGAVYDIYPWLEENCYKYGFILRYPGDKTELTGVAHEEWHFRYVGVEAATAIHEQGLCLEEYLEAELDKEE